jgi:hypothetical protein
MPSLAQLLIGGWIATALVGYGWHWVDKADAVRTAWSDARTACRDTLKKVEAGINKAADKRIADAKQAADEVPPAPETDAELEKLCHRDPNCRSRPD